jgi:peptidoglycan/xylan/chitin deacetylase (PgdA/CDA1 family)
MGTVLASPTWAKFTTTFTPPAGAKSMAAYQILAKVGYIISDDYSLNAYTPQPFNRALVSVSFDDGWANQYQNAFPLLTQYGIPATFNIISGELARSRLANNSMLVSGQLMPAPILKTTLTLPS